MHLVTGPAPAGPIAISRIGRRPPSTARQVGPFCTVTGTCPERRAVTGERCYTIPAFCNAHRHPMLGRPTAMTVELALYQPDIAANTGTLLRLGACLGVGVHLIHPAGFALTDRNLRRAGLDYLDRATLSTISTGQRWWNTRALPPSTPGARKSGGGWCCSPPRRRFRPMTPATSRATCCCWAGKAPACPTPWRQAPTCACAFPCAPICARSMSPLPAP